MGSIPRTVLGIEHLEYIPSNPNIFRIFFPDVFIAILRVLLKVFRLLFMFQLHFITTMLLSA